MLVGCITISRVGCDTSSIRSDNHLRLMSFGVRVLSLLFVQRLTLDLMNLDWAQARALHTQKAQSSISLRSGHLKDYYSWSLFRVTAYMGVSFIR